MLLNTGRPRIATKFLSLTINWEVFRYACQSNSASATYELHIEKKDAELQQNSRVAGWITSNQQ